MKITKEQARQYMLSYQKLLPPREMKGKEGVLEYIRSVGCIQFDPLNMVGSNPYLVLQSRVDKFKPRYLDELLYNDRKLLDGWDKNMSIYPVEDWPYFERFRERDLKRHGGENSPIYNILPQIREVIEKNGPVSSKDLEFDTIVNWAWAPTRAARAALESMYFWGELIIQHKEGTRKFYDSAEKHIGSEILSKQDPNKSMEQYYAWHIKRRIGSVGMLWTKPSDAWLGIINLKSKERTEAFLKLEQLGEILSLEVEDMKNPFYIRSSELNVLQSVLDGAKIKKEAAFLAPLDNILWDRKVIKEIFNFEYVWEVYKPASERKYGYYVLPVLYGDRFVARFEPRFNRKTKKLEIINWWWEPKVKQSSLMNKAIAKCFNEFLYYLDGDGIEFANEGNAKENLSGIIV